MNCLSVSKNPTANSGETAVQASNGKPKELNRQHLMSEPKQSYEIDFALARGLRDQTWSFTLSPNLWEHLTLQQPLNWLRVTFDETSASQLPNNLIGVYAFVLEHDTANLKLAYLLYVGKTTENFRVRFGKYKRHQREEVTNRYLVKLMLTTWPGRLAFYYAPIDGQNIVEHIEGELIAAFKPPACRQYPAKVRAPFNILDKFP